MCQVDVLIELEAKGHTISILDDAKFRKDTLDVKDIEDVLALAEAFNASKSVIVAANGQTGSAETKAELCNVDVRLLSVDEALVQQLKTGGNCVRDLKQIASHLIMLGFLRQMKAFQFILPDSVELVDLPFYGAARVAMKGTYSPAIRTSATADIFGLALKMACRDISRQPKR